MMGRYGHMGQLRIASATDHIAVDEALNRVGMSSLLHRQIGELSGGQRKRVFIARALAQQGQVILLDEPFTGVDVQKLKMPSSPCCAHFVDEGRVILVAQRIIWVRCQNSCDGVVKVNGNARCLTTGQWRQILPTNISESVSSGGVLRHLRQISGKELHDDMDSRQVSILTDDERPFVTYDGKHQTARGKDEVDG